MNMFNNLMNLLNNDFNNISDLLTNYYNKKVYINTYKLKYNYLDTELLSNLMIKIYMNNNKGLTLRSMKNIINKLPYTNDKLVSENYVKTINKYNLYLNNNMINLMNNQKLLNNNNDFLMNLFNKDKDLFKLDITNKLLLGKYLVGTGFKLKGRTLNKNITRSMTLQVMNGTFNNYTYQWSKLNNLYKLNHLSQNINVTNYSSINKNGKFNMKIKLNTI
ncbi:AaceriMI004Wp (mitochondrion) [[Ashbya] aceris (nom. inval.)]|nr:AaceriMI004Wp [[Ashbya] aceris (nom. inval.)]